MKLTFNFKNDGQYHQYCFLCHDEAVERVYEGSKTYYYCNTCKKKHERSIVIDPAIKWWVADDGTYWHESSGVFIRNPDGKFLFFERTIFPFALTVPSGHVDAGEEPYNSAIREIQEEVGVTAKGLTHITSENITGDSCRRGSDDHAWHAYLLLLSVELDVSVKEEGERPVWLTLDEAKGKDLTYPVKYIINNYSNELTRDIDTESI